MNPIQNSVGRVRAILLLGPTASGKTACALHLAERFPIEIVSVDSALVYHDMNIGTAKPRPEELAVCPHHLIDVVTPEESYSAARFAAEALRLIGEIAARGKIPLLAGGTMLYFKALREGLSDLPEADAALRAEIEARAAKLGWPVLHAELGRIDPAAAERLNPNDAQRIQRALEIVTLTGRPLAESYAQRGDCPAAEVDFLTLALLPSDRAVLHARIERRFGAMLDLGLLEEVRALRAKYQLDVGMASMRCVGYRQAWEYIDGGCDYPTLVERGVAATRQLAKRQMTWMRQFRKAWDEVHEFDCLDVGINGKLESCVRAWLLRFTTVRLNERSTC